MIKEQFMEADQSSAFTGDEKPQGFLVVGLGASAGGIQALKEFFEHVPVDSGMAYVVILHLSPDHDSKLAEVLQTVSAIPVLQVLEKTPIVPNHIYVVPPNQHLLIKDGAIAPTINLHMEDRRAPVDIFFRNLADTHGPRAICVVLSGTGANGSMGLKRIKERGGVAYVQNPREAEFNEMPRNAIATELVDEVLPVAQIPARIIAYRDSLGSVEIMLESDQRPEQQQQALREIFTLLRNRTGNDFSNYKRATLLRRIERRINIRSLPDLPSYTAFLNEHPDEIHSLLKDLLISVTNFFRDLKTFEILESEVLPPIFKEKKTGEEVRIWVAGCATGEEAYSIAILCAERVLGIANAPKVQIFATDIDEAAITTAREGLYSLNDVADVSPDRLRLFFTMDGDLYRVRREIREMVVFATHNFLKDPPFSRLDLVTCRNVLIYLNSTAQERVAETFHFALRPKGFLFLGTSETVDGASDLFAVFNRENHIYQARETAVRHFPVPSSVPNFHFTKNNPLQKTDENEVRQHHPSFGELHQRLLEEYAAPSVVVNEDYEIVHLSEKAGRYLEFSGGEPSQNLLKLIRPEIRLELRTALYQAVQNNTIVEARNIKLNGQAQQSLDIQVRPVLATGDGARGFILVLFKPNESVKPDEETVVTTIDEPVAKKLEEELILLKSQLRSSSEQHDFQAEELKASNEELQAMNEELRSAAEELETSKEELQSINEELRTVNQELKIKIEETSLTSNNLQNLINSANLGTIFLDRNFTIRLFTPAVLDIFNLKSGDYGRPVSDITHKLQYNNLLTDAETVLGKLLPIEREVATTDGRFFLMRLLPYRTAEDRINGVVVTFFDITNRKESEKALQQSEEYLRLIIESAKAYAIFTLDTKRNIVQWSTGAEAMMGYSAAEIIGQSADIIFTREDRIKKEPEKEKEKAEKVGRAENECWHLRKDGSRFWGSGSVSPLRDNSGKLIGFVKIMRDLTEHRRGEEALRQSKEQLRLIIESAKGFAIFTTTEKGFINSWNTGAAEIFGWQEEEIIGQGADVLFTPEDRTTNQSQIEMETAVSKGVAPDIRWHLHKNGSLVFITGFVHPVYDASGKLNGFVKIGRDITAQHNAEMALRESEENYRVTLEKEVEQRTAELKEMNTNLRYANENLQQFASIASHDLQEPLRKIKLFTSVLSKKWSDLVPDEGKGIIQKITQASDRMGQLIQEVLDYSRIAYGAKEFEKTDLNGTLENVFGDLDLLMEEAGAVIQYPQPLPTLEAIPLQMHQLFYNLMTNALKFRRRNIAPVIQITARPLVASEVKKYDALVKDIDYLEIVVSDNGIGFDPQFSEQIFQIFERLHTVDEFEGTGVGLALCKKIVENHHGHIFAVSNDGAGASFHVILPLKQ
jgi:two-component system, chemotaxis family, CheB/CheR fusion protein